MELKQLESFVAVVVYKSFTEAAKQLYISQPTISTHIQALEKELETKLIVRTTKSIELTKRGAELYECAVKMLDLRDGLLEKWRSWDEKIIRLGVSTIPSAYILPEFLPKFCKEYPEVFFQSIQSDSKGIIEGVLDGRMDVGLVGMEWEEEVLACIPFYEDELVVITPVTEHFLALRKKEVPLEELFKEPMILREKGSGTKKAADQFLEKQGISKDSLKVAAYMNDPEAIKNSVEAGLGISIVSKKAAENMIREKRLLAFEFSRYTSGRKFYIIYRKDDVLKPFISTFINYIQKYYRN